MLKTVISKPFKLDNESVAIELKYGFQDLAPKQQLPYFSITGNIYNVKKDGGFKRTRNGDKINFGGGCIHDVIKEHMPEFAELIRFHLVDSSALPMHYIANSTYHLSNGNVDGFKSCSLFVENIDTVPELDVAEQWLLNRLPQIKDDFYNTLEKFGFDVKSLRTKLLK